MVVGCSGVGGLSLEVEGVNTLMGRVGPWFHDDYFSDSEWRRCTVFIRRLISVGVFYWNTFPSLGVARLCGVSGSTKVDIFMKSGGNAEGLI